MFPLFTRPTLRMLGLLSTSWKPS